MDERILIVRGHITLLKACLANLPIYSIYYLFVLTMMATKSVFFFCFFEWYKKDLSSNGVFNEIKMKKTEVYLVNWVASMLRIRKNWGNRALHRKWCWRYQVERQASWRSCGRMIQKYGRILCTDWEQSRFPGSNVSTRVVSPRWEKHFLSSYFCPFSLFSEVSVLLLFF